MLKQLILVNQYAADLYTKDAVWDSFIQTNEYEEQYNYAVNWEMEAEGGYASYYYVYRII